MLLQNIWKSLKYFFFLFFFFIFSSPAVVPPLTPQQFGGEEVARDRVFLWCLAAPYTPRILDILLMCVYICKMSNSLCASASASVTVGLLVDSSLHGEAAGLLHSRQQFLIEFLVRLVGRDVYPVKTRDRKRIISDIKPDSINIKRETCILHLLCVLTTCEPWAGCLCWHLSNGWWRALVLQNL